MTTTAPTMKRGLPVFGGNGEMIATVSQARSEYLASLLAECDRGHVYILPDELAEWLATEATCPRCRLLGLTEGTTR